MITRERIETLATFDARGARVLSLLLDLDPAAARRLVESGGGIGALLRSR